MLATWPASGSCLDGPFFGFESTTYWQRVTIEVSAPGAYELDSGGRLASVTRCLTAPADLDELPEIAGLVTGDWKHSSPSGDLSYSLDDWAGRVLELDAGLHEVWVRRSREQSSMQSEMSLRAL